ncbi:FAD-dependent oxidoreductase [Curtobacterium sp. MCLR17_007]|uniref:FAD-dependent oxidoreductase n=1 Tax=Curtobacterium sp. MCLR17_007 TaxID=2175648 RepID=UPI000DA81317
MVEADEDVPMKRVVVGASIAYHLAKAGAQVSVNERDMPASGASGASFAWIGKGPTPPSPAHRWGRRSSSSTSTRRRRTSPVS